MCFFVLCERLGLVMPIPTGASIDRSIVAHDRYVFVHSFEDTGERQVVKALESHPWTRSHVAEAAVAGGGCTLTSSIPAVEERQRATGTTLSEVRYVHTKSKKTGPLTKRPHSWEITGLFDCRRQKLLFVIAISPYFLC